MQHKIICGDNKEILRDLLNDSIDLTVTSPPYDEIRDYDGYDFDFESVAKELYRVTKKGGIVVWVVADQVINGSESGTSFRQALYFKEVGFNLHDTMIYNKNGQKFPSMSRYDQRFEYMFVLSKGKPKTYNLIRIYNPASKIASFPHTERGKNGILKNVIYKKKNHWKLKGNVWLYDIGFYKSSKDKIAFKHPAIFPEKLVKDHITSWSNENDTILDPFLGSGTTSKMAELLNRNSIGIDISHDYCENSYNRLSNIIRQGRLSRKPSTIERIDF